MPVSGTIADGFIKIALKGYEAAKAQLKTLKEQGEKLSTALQSIGAQSAIGFAVGSAAIKGFLNAADPVRFAIFQAKLEILSMYIGRAFVPILKEAIVWVDRITDYFRNLSSQQMDSILHWTKVGMGILAVGTAIGTATLAITKFISVFKTLTVVAGLFSSTTGIGIVVSLLGILSATGRLNPLLKMITNSLGGVSSQTASMSLLFDQLGKIAGSIIELFTQLEPQLMEIGKAFAEVGTSLLSSGFTILITVLPAVSSVISYLTPLVVKLAKAIADVTHSCTPLITGLLALGAAIYVVNAAVTAAMAMSGWGLVIIGVAAAIAVLSAAVRALNSDLDKLDEALKRGQELNMQGSQARVKGYNKQIQEVMNISDPKKREEELQKLKEYSNRQKVGYEQRINNDQKKLEDLDKNTSEFGTWLRGDSKEAKMKELKDQIAVAKQGLSETNNFSNQIDAAMEENKKKSADKYSTLPVLKRPEIFGVEEGFKRAQQGAVINPEKLKEQERQKMLSDLAKKQTDLLGDIKKNTDKRPGAESAY